MRILASHQPNFFPYIGVWEKFLLSDVFVWADDMQYVHRDFHRRGYLSGPTGKDWLGIHVEHRFGQKINEVMVKSTDEVVTRLREWYAGSYWAKELLKQLTHQSPKNLSDLNMGLIHRFLCSGLLGKNFPEQVISSEISPKVKTTATERIIWDCTRLHCDTYLSGSGGRNYLDLRLMDRCGINVIFQEPVEFTYTQRYSKSFIPGCCLLDILVNNAVFEDFLDACGEKKRVLHG